jgi:hypothetical protein
VFWPAEAMRNRIVFCSRQQFHNEPIRWQWRKKTTSPPYTFLCIYVDFYCWPLPQTFSNNLYHKLLPSVLPQAFTIKLCHKLLPSTFTTNFYCWPLPQTLHTIHTIYVPWQFRYLYNLYLQSRYLYVQSILTKNAYHWPLSLNFTNNLYPQPISSTYSINYYHS